MSNKILFSFLIITLSNCFLFSKPNKVAKRNGYTQYEKVKLENFSWVSKSLKKEHVYKSKKVKYALWALGTNSKDIMTLAWDESKGTGTGYDTFYVDKNFNGDMTDPGEKITLSIKTGKNKQKTYKYYFGEIVGSTGTTKITLNMSYSRYYKGSREDKVPEIIQWQSSFTFTDKANVKISIGVLPGNLVLNFNQNLIDAPIYRIGGEAYPFILRTLLPSKETKWKKVSVSLLPGSDIGTWKAGKNYKLSLAVALAGNKIANQFRFFRAKFPGGEPQAILLVKDGDKIVDEIPFNGGCGGSYSVELFVPSRVPSGRHTVAIRMNRKEIIGGLADYLFAVAIDNPNFGKPQYDDAYLTLKKNFPKAKFASLRRLSSEDVAYKAYPEENVISTLVIDNSIKPSNQHWPANIDSYGKDKILNIGQGPGFKAKVKNLIKFDLSNIGSETKILGAWIRTALIKGASTLKDGKLNYYALRRNWYENKTDDGYSCWNGPNYKHDRNKTRQSGFWGKPGAADAITDHFPEIAGTTKIDKFPLKGETSRLIVADITTIVKKWHSGEIKNNGIMQTYVGTGYSSQGSSEFQDYILRPTLVIAYSGKTPSQRYYKPLEKNFKESLALAKKRNRPLIIKFYTDFCTSCKLADKTIFKSKKVKKILKADFQYVNLNLEDNKKLAFGFGVGSVPSVVILNPDGTRKAIINSEIILEEKMFRKALSENK